MKKYLALIIVSTYLFTIMPESLAQDSVAKTDKTEPVYPPQFSYLKFALTNISELEGSLQFGYEFPLTKKSRMLNELGYITIMNPLYYLMQGAWPENIEANGFRISSKYKRYFDFQNRSQFNNYRYFGVILMFKYIKIVESSQSISMLDGNYWQIIDIANEKYVGTLHFVFGYDKYMSSRNKMFIDHSFGIGFRYKYINSNLPDNALENDLIWYDRKDGFMLSATWKIKLGFAL